MLARTAVRQVARPFSTSAVRQDRAGTGCPATPEPAQLPMAHTHGTFKLTPLLPLS